MSVDVSVVIVTYHCRDEALECLASIVRGTREASYELIVLDNASGDGTVEAISRAYPQAKVLELDENIGFARGVNRAAEEATGDFILLLNPDTVVHDGSIDRLVAFARSAPQHGLYGGRAFNPDGSLQPGSCWGKPTVWSLFCFATMLSSVFKGSSAFDPESLGAWRRDTVREVDVVTGCLLLVTTEAWRALEGLDGRYFMYGEDADFSLRAKALGYRPVITPAAVITHEVGVSSASRPDKIPLLLKGKVTLLDTHWPPVRRWVGTRLLLTGVAFRALTARLRSADRDTATLWTTAWRERRSWLAGFARDGRARPADR